MYEATLDETGMGETRIWDPNSVRVVETLALSADDGVLYIVPVGYVFYLEEAHLNVTLDFKDSPHGFNYISWYNLADDLIRDICQIWICEEDPWPTGAFQGDHAIFLSNLRLVEGHYLGLTSQHAGMLAEGSISGFLVRDYEDPL